MILDGYQTHCRCGRVESGTANRRQFLRRAGAGFGMLALADLLAATASSPTRPRLAGPMAPRPPHLAPRARSVIWLFMEGGPARDGHLRSQARADQASRAPPGKSIDVFFGSPGPLMKSPFGFRRHGESGAWVCDRLPHLARHVDDLALIKSCYAESPAHGPAMYQMNTGMVRAGFPSAGSWACYGFGTENQDLPGFVVLQNSMGSKGGAGNWGSGFLPTPIRARASAPRACRSSTWTGPRTWAQTASAGCSSSRRAWNREHAELHPGEPDLLGAGSRTTSWPTGCSPRRRRPWTSPPSPSTPGDSTASTTRRSRALRREVPPGSPAGRAWSALRPGLLQ